MGQLIILDKNIYRLQYYTNIAVLYVGSLYIRLQFNYKAKNNNKFSFFYHFMIMRKELSSDEML